MRDYLHIIGTKLPRRLRCALRRLGHELVVLGTCEIEDRIYSYMKEPPSTDIDLVLAILIEELHKLVGPDDLNYKRVIAYMEMTHEYLQVRSDQGAFRSLD